MKHYILLTLNTLSLIGALYINYLSGTGYFGKTVGEVSAQNDTLFTPAGYAFGIWGLIYLMLIAFVIYQWYVRVKNKDGEYIERTGALFILSNIFNSLWIITWLNGNIGISMIVILLLLISLIFMMFRLKLEVWDAPVRVIALVWWPICIYLGWIIVASVANASIYLKSIQWGMAGIGEATWAIIMIIISSLIYVFLIFTRNLREAAGVGIWALTAIAIKQMNANREIAIAAIICSAALFLLIVYHGYKNRATSPFVKISRGEI